jgi:hypothetical protein
MFLRSLFTQICFLFVNNHKMITHKLLNYCTRFLLPSPDLVFKAEAAAGEGLEVVVVLLAAVLIVYRRHPAVDLLSLLHEIVLAHQPQHEDVHSGANRQLLHACEFRSLSRKRCT